MRDPRSAVADWAEPPAARASGAGTRRRLANGLSDERRRPVVGDPPILMVDGARRPGVRLGAVTPWIRFAVVITLVLGAATLLVPTQDGEPAVQSSAPIVERAGTDPAIRASTTPVETPSRSEQAGSEPGETQTVVPPPVPPAPEPTPPVTTRSGSAVENAAEPRSPERPVDAAPRGLLFINSRPWGRVLIDGREVGNTPLLSAPIAPGTHQLRVERDGFHSFEMTVTVQPGEEFRMTDIVLRALIP